MKDERGMTLVESLVALAIAGLITGILVTAIYLIYEVTGWGNSQLSVQHDLQNAATWLNRDVLTASKANITQEVSGSQVTLTIPYSITDTTILTHTITYEYSPETGNLTRDSVIIARYVNSEPFSQTGVITAPNVVPVTLHSEKGDVPGSGTFALKMRAGGSMAAHLCQVTGAGSLGFDGSKVSWDITNDGDTSPSIDEIYITWPITNSGLNGIRLDTSLIWDGLQSPPSATISSWEPGSREIYSGTHTLEFSFVSGAVSDEAQYSITITLTDKCPVPFPTP